MKLCTNLSLNRELRSVRPSQEIEEEHLELEVNASKFLKCYIRQHCAIYADLQFEIEETKVPPKVEENGE